MIQKDNVFRNNVHKCLCALAVVFGSTHVAGAIVEKLLPLRVSRKCTGRCSGSPRSVGGWHRKTGVWELWIASAVVVWSAVPFSTTERGVAVRRAGSAVSVFFPIDAVVLSLVARSLLAEHAVAGIPCSALAEPSERHC
ncbi:hypothetical protein BLNAU_25128 [Blattamonas nauphoetae]|uniref:Secreted protein n=1 Tax=Blattamonas nauphoetae TaxID=2049346 RepID=A0ABQ9WKG2_9EUKA|nr:hypothetical protein BLNAU_25128 [Blattamonas nauphoetae]